MALIKPIEGISPQIHDSVYLAETAVVIGKTKIGKNSSVWFNAVIRADVNDIIIGEYSNIQDNACVHCTFQKAATVIGDYVTVGHNAVVHGCKIGNYALIGMGSVVMDEAVIGDGAIIAAGAVIMEKTIVPEGTIWAGVPAKQVKELDKEKIKQYLGAHAERYHNYVKWWYTEK
jgi:carbonic anhydrase/acetyltransferase-like protein (isoleucine patch superfamily)